MPSRILKRLPSLPAQILLHGACLVLFLLMFLHVKHLYEIQAIRTAAERVHVSLLEVESGQRGFLLTGNDAYLDNYRYHRKILKMRLEILCRMIPRTDSNKTICIDIEKVIKQKLDEMDETIWLTRSGDHVNALAVVRSDRGLQWMRQIEAELDLIRTGPGFGDGAFCQVVE